MLLAESSAREGRRLLCGGFCTGVFVCVYVGGFLEDLYMKSEIQTGLKFDKFRQITVRVYVQKGFVAYRTYSIVIQCTPCS